MIHYILAQTIRGHNVMMIIILTIIININYMPIDTIQLTLSRLFCQHIRIIIKKVLKINDN